MTDDTALFDDQKIIKSEQNHHVPLVANVVLVGVRKKNWQLLVIFQSYVEDSVKFWVNLFQKHRVRHHSHVSVLDLHPYFQLFRQFISKT